MQRCLRLDASWYRHRLRIEYSRQAFQRSQASPIWRARRRPTLLLARKYHPDVSKEKNAEGQFKKIGEAYAVLKDPEKRAAAYTYCAQ